MYNSKHVLFTALSNGGHYEFYTIRNMYDIPKSGKDVAWIKAEDWI